MGIEDADLILLVGTNPRYEAPLLNARMRKSYVYKEMDIALIGPKVDLSYHYEHLGDTPDILQKLQQKSHPFYKKLSSAKKPLIIVGSECLERDDGGAVLHSVQQIIKSLPSKDPEWKIFNVLHRVASQVAALDLGYTPGVAPVREMKPKVLFLLGADEGAVTRADLKDSFVIYLGKFHIKL